MSKVFNKIKNAENVKILCIFIRLKGGKLAKKLAFIAYFFRFVLSTR